MSVGGRHHTSCNVVCTATLQKQMHGASVQQMCYRESCKLCLLLVVMTAWVGYVCIEGVPQVTHVHIMHAQVHTDL